jgi:drug/metabolite transporter (DMT)-like permease
MSVAALGLVLAAAVSHAAWNLYAKRAEGGPVFVWLCAAVGAAAWAPVAIAALMIAPPAVGLAAVAWLAVSAVLHTTYYVALQAGYDRGDLSVVYPLARGTGAILAVVGAVAILGERPSTLALLGALLIGVGILLLSGSAPTRSRDLWPALATGAVISIYTVWDAYLVTELAIPALSLVWAADLGRVAVLGPLAHRRSAEVARVWRGFRREVIAVALLSPLAYILVLLALRFAPVSYVAPAREVSIVIGVLFGWRLLGERDVGRRLVSTAMVVTGMVLATLG